MSGTPIGRLKIKCGGSTFSILTLWQSDKGISVNLDKHSDKYPAMGPIEALKKWAKGEGYLNYFPTDSAPRAAAPASSRATPPVDPWIDGDEF